MKPTTKATVILAVLMGVLTIVSSAVIRNIYGDDAKILQVLPFLSGFFVLFGALTIATLDSLKADGQKYMNAFMLLKGAKLLIVLTACTVYVMLNKEQAVPFLIVFSIYYVIYLIFEVTASQKPIKD